MTATPVGTWKIFFTPGTAFAFESSKLATFPPNTGHRAITAYSIPGKRVSRPNLAVPFTLDFVSRRFMDFPMYRKSFGSFNGAAAGTAIFDAASDRLP